MLCEIFSFECWDVFITSPNINWLEVFRITASFVHCASQMNKTCLPSMFLVSVLYHCFQDARALLVHVFKNWKLLFKNICGNTCGWKSVLKYVKCCLKTENGCLKIQTKHPYVLRLFFLMPCGVISFELVSSHIGWAFWFKIIWTSTQMRPKLVSNHMGWAFAQYSLYFSSWVHGPQLFSSLGNGLTI